MECAARQEAPQERAQAGKAGADDAEGLLHFGPDCGGDAGVGFVDGVELFECGDAHDGGDEDTVPTGNLMSALRT